MTDRLTSKLPPTVAGVLLLAGVGLVGCGGVSSAKTAGTSAAGTSSVQPATLAAATTPAAQVAQPVVIPGLRVTVPSSWPINEDNPVNFDVSPPGRPNEVTFIWLNMRAVKSTGPGHGTTVLKSVGTTPSALVRWLTTNPDFRVLASPARASIGHVPMTTLVIGVSSTARYGDPHCPANPHCADVFTNPTYQHGDWFGIGGHEVVRMFLGHTSAGTVIVGLDANNPTALKHLETVGEPLLDSIRFPH
jgi:hypothetical protein